MAIIVLGFLCAWTVTTVLEKFGLTRHAWRLPLFFAALAPLFGSDFPPTPLPGMVAPSSPIVPNIFRFQRICYVPVTGKDSLHFPRP
jgi:hypothetical protein